MEVVYRKGGCCGREEFHTKNTKKEMNFNLQKCARKQGRIFTTEYTEFHGGKEH